MSTITKIVCIFILLKTPCHPLDTKQHYYFDAKKKRYFHLTNTLPEYKKQIIHQKIETEINMVKKLAAANNLVLFLTSATSAIFAANSLQEYFRHEQNPHDLHFGIILAGSTAFLSIRSYIYKNDINKKIAKLLFKQSLLET